MTINPVGVQLSTAQREALAEAVGIAFGRAAAGLSDLTGQRVLLQPPELAICPMPRLHEFVGRFLHGDVATVHQIFRGVIAGDALLLLDQESALVLVDLLLGGETGTGRLDGSAREVLNEVGNIVLNACLGTFGNLLQVHVTFSVPRVELDTLREILESLVIGTDELRYALVVGTLFRVRDTSVSGYLMIVLGVASLDVFLQAVERWGREQENGTPES
ncbi:MAG: chemotaxis protein CheC [Armatimonadota bacterium]|nr:chemotaxis protein CheC [Armatimonadota bacterium]